MEKTNTIISQVEEFIKGIHEGDIVLTPDAKTIIEHIKKGKDLLGRPVTEDISLAEQLGRDMYSYQTFTNDLAIFESDLEKLSPTSIPSYLIEKIRHEFKCRLDETSKDLLMHIEIARTHGVVKEQKLSNKIEELQEQNTKLKEENDKIQKECKRLKEINEELHKALNKFGQRVGNNNSDKAEG
jgi:predicted nuclease with TOPRIM domain